MESTRNELRFLNDDKPVSKIVFNKTSDENLEPVEARYKFKTDEQFERAQKMAAELKEKYPNMKPNRIAKKIAAYFHLEQVS